MTFRVVSAGAAALFIIAAALALDAQAPQPPAQAPAPATTSVSLPPVSKISLTVGRSLVLTTPFEARTVSITNPAIADFTAVKPTELLIDGKAPGTVSLIVFG